MAADSQNFSVYAGDDAIINTSIVDENGKPLSLIGSTFIWTLSPAAGGAAVVTKTLGGGITLTHPASGALAIQVGHADTAGLVGAMWHQLVMTEPNGSVSTVTTGTITFKVRT